MWKGVSGSFMMIDLNQYRQGETRHVFAPSWAKLL
jgi:hypothetical protein